MKSSIIKMRKYLSAIILTIGLVVSMTGYANVKAYDSGPPGISYAVGDQSYIFEVPATAGEFVDPPVTGEYPEACKVTATQQTHKKPMEVFIDRHRRTGYGSLTIKQETTKNTSIKFLDRHRLSCTEHS